MHCDIIKTVGLEKEKRPMFRDNSGRALSNHALMYILKGHGYFEDARTERTLIKAGSMFFLYPDRWHNFDPTPGTVWSEYWVLFDGTAAENLFGKIIPTDNPVHFHGISPVMRENYESLYGAWTCKNRFSPEYSLYLLHSILMQAFMKINNIPSSDDGGIISRAKAAVKSSINKNFNIDFREFAEKENAGYEKFRKEFAKETGFSPHNYLTAMKINRAMELLCRPMLSIKEISDMLGFQDPYYFSRLFKKREGLSPENYRKKILSKYKQNY